MEIETKLNDKIVKQLSDYDAKRYPEWIESWLSNLFASYRQMSEKNLITSYERNIEPLVSWLTPEARQKLGEALWLDRRDWLTSHSVEEPYALTGLASYLAPLVGGA